MKVLANVLGFSMVMIVVFTLITNLLPQVEGEAPVATKIDLGSLTPESYASLGEDLFSGKGTCTLCHNSLGRAPDILKLDMVSTVKARLADAGYKGQSTDVEGYIRESMIEPSAYVVAGFGKKGAPDVSPMPNVAKAPLNLSEVEINALIAFLQSKDGGDITVPLPSADAAPVADEGGEEEDAMAETAEAALSKFGCASCHIIGEGDADIGPNLNAVGSRLSVARFVKVFWIRMP